MRMGKHYTGMMNPTECDRQIERVRLELLTRRFMIALVGFIGAWVGIAIVLTGAPSFVEAVLGPWSRYAIGSVPLISGLAISGGYLWGEETRCGWWSQVLGLSGMTLWYSTVALIYASFAINAGITLLGFGEPLPDQMTRGFTYVPFTYLGLALMAATPLVALIKIGRI